MLDKYRFGFNGQEKINEWAGIGNFMDFGERGYDSRVARFPTLDPIAKKFPWQSPYIFAANSPILFIDYEGSMKLSYNAKMLTEEGVSKVGLQRFETIIKNIGILVRDNPQALEVIMNTTGLSKETILKDLEYGEGPTVSILQYPPGARGGKSGIVFDVSIIKRLGEANSTDLPKLANQVLGTAITLLHEYGHYGDQVTNNGMNSGQFEIAVKERPDGKTFRRVFYGELFGEKENTNVGRQKWKTSLTGHRGEDIETFGFGVNPVLQEDGSFRLDKVNPASETTNTENIPAPASPTESIQGTNILNTLDVK